jgi:putative DNA primase/helicase
MSAAGTEAKSSIDKEELKQAARGRWLEILPRLCNIDAAILDGNHHPCPKCGGRDRFSMVDEANGALLCRKCFCGGNGDGLSAVSWLAGCDFPTALNKVADAIGFNNVAPSMNGHGTNTTVDPLEIIAKLKGVSQESFVAYGAVSMAALSQIRFPAFGPQGKQCTTFDIRHRGTEEQRKGKFQQGKPAGLFFPVTDSEPQSPVEKRVPRLPMAGETWHLVEGVKDAAALHSLGLLACGLNTSSLNKKFARLFECVNVIVIPDRDEAGEAGAKKTAHNLLGVAASIRNATLPAEYKKSDGTDVRDVLKLPNGRELVLQAFADAKPASETADAAAKEVLPTVEGYYPRLTDMGNAQRFAAQHGDNVRYCYGWQSWFFWSGDRWVVDAMGEIERLAKTTARNIYKETADDRLDHDEAKKTAEWAFRSQTLDRIRAMIALARSEQPIPVDLATLDTEPWLLNCENGTIDLTTGELREHRKGDFITKRCPVEYPESGGDDPELWLSFLDRIFAGNAELIGFIRRLMGMSLSGAVVDHVLPIFWGSGANGKSVLINTWCGMLGGDYAMKAPQNFLMVKRGDSHPTELADLCGKRLVAAVETSDGSRLSETLIKELTGNDSIRARRMRQDFWEFNPTHKIVVATNHKPIIRGTDHAIWRRILLVPFTVTIPSHEMDRRLVERLKKEWSTILRWAVAGCLEWRKNGLGEPEAVKGATQQYHTDSDTFGSFIEECCLVGKPYRVKASVLYSHYKQWIESRGEHPESLTRFGTKFIDRIIKTPDVDGKIAEQQITKQNSGGSIWYYGITNREIPQDSEYVPGDL